MLGTNTHKNKAPKKTINSVDDVKELLERCKNFNIHEKKDTKENILKELSEMQEQLKMTQTFLASPEYQAYNDNSYKDSLLHYLVEKKNFKKAKELITNGTDVNSIDSARQTALMIACRKLAEKKYENSFREEVFEFVKFLVKMGANVNMKSTPNLSATGDDCAIDFSRMCNCKITEFLLENGAILDNSKPLIINSMTLLKNNDSTTMAKLMLKHGANPNEVCKATGLPVIYISLLQNSFEIIHLLIDYNANLDDFVGSETVLVGLCRLSGTLFKNTNEYSKLIKLIIKKGANVKLKNQDGKTAMDFLKDNFRKLNFKKMELKKLLKLKTKKTNTKKELLIEIQADIDSYESYISENLKLQEIMKIYG